MVWEDFNVLDYWYHVWKREVKVYRNVHDAILGHNLVLGTVKWMPIVNFRWGRDDYGMTPYHVIGIYWGLRSQIWEGEIMYRHNFKLMYLLPIMFRWE